MISRRRDFKKILIDKGVEKACLKMDFDFEKDFIVPSEDQEEKYEDYQWYVLEHSKFGPAIHAVPPVMTSEKLPWEEWFIFEGNKVHTVLLTKKPEKFDGEFEGIAGDPDHPEEVLGYYWYYSFDNSFIPKLFQNK